MTPCDEIRPFLEEFHDGELGPPAAERIRGHVRECAACAGELETLARLDRALREGSGGRVPEAEPYLAALGARLMSLRDSRWKRFVPLAAAAAVAVLVWSRRGGEDVPGIVKLVDEHYEADPIRQAEIERDLVGAVNTLKGLVAHAVPRRRAVAAAVLARHPDPAVREWLLAFARPDPETPAGWELAEIGTEPTDRELAGWALELARSPKTSEEAFRILRKLHRGGTDRESREVIASLVRGLLGSPVPSDAALALEVVRRLDLKFLLPELVELLDVPGLGDRALEFLKAQTGRDFGRDADAWREYFRSRKT